MKKFLSIVAVVALVFALAVPAFAADDAVGSVTNDPNKVMNATVVSEIASDLKVNVAAANIDEDQTTKLNAAVNDLPDDAFVSDIVDVTLVNDQGVEVSFADLFEGGTAKRQVNIAFAVDQTTQKVVAVLYWNANTKEWDTAEIVESTDDSITVSFAHLCAVAFVMADVTTDPAQSNTTNTTNQTAQTPAKGKSPQTGYDVLGWAVAVSALVMAAGYCFVSARKVTE